MSGTTTRRRVEKSEVTSKRKKPETKVVGGGGTLRENGEGFNFLGGTEKMKRRNKN